MSSTPHFASVPKYPSYRAALADPRQGESGITMVLFGMLIAVIIMIVSIVVDIGKQELALTQIRQTADAAALSAARQLNGRPDGWRAAKIAAAMILKRYPIHGVDPAWQDALTIQGGDRAYWDAVPTSGYAVPPLTTLFGDQGDAGGYHVTVKRGMIRAMKDDPDKTEFVSLEGDSQQTFMSGATYLFANAVEVNVHLDSLPGIFTHIFQSLGFSSLHATSHAVMHSTMQRVVWPVGVNYFDIMLDTAPQTFSATHQLPYAIPENEIAREVEVGVLNKDGRRDNLDFVQSLDPDPLGQLDARTFINEGLTRYRSFYRFPYTWFYSTTDAPTYPADVCYQGTYTGIGPNCKSIPIQAYFALPGSGSVTPEKIVQAIENGGITARVGDTVTGLMNLGTFATDASLSQRIVAAINGSEKTFSSFFIKPNGIPQDNYPFLRTTRAGLHNPAGPGEAQDPQYRPEFDGWEALIGNFAKESLDLLISYPSNEAADEGEISSKQRFIMGDMSAQGYLGQLNFVNPMCHFDGIPINDLSANGNKVAEVYAMVVAPRKERTSDGREIKYRDFAMMFRGGQQDAIAEVPETEPTVVGFVKIGIFDGNTLALNVRFPVAALPPTSNEDVVLRTSTPTYGTVYDNNPAYIDLSQSAFRKDVQTYSGKVEDSYNCYDSSSSASERANCSTPTSPPSTESLAMLSNCFNLKAIEDEWDDAMSDLGDWGTVQPCCVSSEDECGIGEGKTCPGCAAGGGCCDRICYGTGSSKIIDKALKLLEDKLSEPLAANPDTHCLYNLLPDSDDANSLSSYDQLHPLSAGYGCGGLRGRMAVMSRRSDDPANYMTGTTWSQQSPTLVDVD